MYTRSHRHQYDVAIIGTGLGSTILGTILSRQGLDVILLERHSHPKFSVGESTTPETSLYLKILALRYDVPELMEISSFNNISRSISQNCGQKLNFGFVFKHKGERYQPGDGFQLGTCMENDSETHLFRQDLDSWMLHTAIHAGCCVYQNTMVEGVDIQDSEVVVRVEHHPDISASFLVDASGHNSLVAKHFGQRQYRHLKTSSRSLFTHMIDVKHFDDLLEQREPRQCSAWSKGTLHHIFPDGWMWVIPFNNYHEARNRLCSVGLMFDARKYSKNIPDGEEFFCDWIAGYPDLKEQFQNARTVREWVITGPIQYSAGCTTGNRWCLLSHAFGFIDPLFSRGLFNTVSTINLLADKILTAFKRGDFTLGHFEPVDKYQQRQLYWNDLLVAGAYICFKHPDLWLWWFRVWGVVSTWGALHALKISQNLEANPADPKTLKQLDCPQCPGAIAPSHPVVNQLLETAFQIVDAFASRTLSLQQTQTQLQALFKSAEKWLPPNFDYLDTQARFGHIDQQEQSLMDFWVSRQVGRW